MEQIEMKVNEFLTGKITRRKELNDLFANKQFMIKLLRKTKNQNYYLICSDELKTDIDFVTKMVDVFDYDLNFVFEMINKCYYTGYVNDHDHKFIHLLAKIDIYLSERESEIDIKYQMQYRQKILELKDYYQRLIEYAKVINPRQNYEENKLGFFVIKTLFVDDDDVQNMFAKRLVAKIFYEYDFEEQIHKKYTKEELAETDFRTVIIDYVNSFDVCLGEYTLKNQKLLDLAKLKLDEVIDNYDNYRLDMNEKVSEFNKKLEKFIEEEHISFDPGLIKLQEIIRLGLDRVFYGEKVELDIKPKKESVVSYDEEKVRLYIRTELKNMFKSKIRKFELKKPE